MIFHSIRFKIILWYMSLLAVTLIIFNVLAYNYFKFSLYRHLDNLLNSRAAGVTESIDTYWETEKQDALNSGIRIEKFSKINNINFAKITRHWVETKSNDPQLLNIIAQIFDNHGNMIVSSIDIPELRRFSIQTFETLNQGNGRFENIKIHLSNSKPLEAKTFTIPVKENDKIAYIVRLITPLSEINAQLTRLRMILFGLLPLIIFFTGIGGAFLAKISLAPVDQMITTINCITSQNLRTRITIPNSKDEIQRLAETFNSMLSRIDNYFFAQQQFIQDISHEIKTPLTIIRGGVEVGLKKIRSPEKYETILENTLEEINKITQVIENLLILAKFDNREISLQIKKFHLNDLMKDVLSEIAILAEAKNLQIEFTENALIDIEADESQIKSLLLNLLDNAVKYTPAQGKIVITLNKKDPWASIDIQDSGIGIAEKDLPHIFDRFYRADPSRHSEKGFGLGLSMVKSITETNKGVISVESQINKGTTFSILLPLHFTSSAAAA